MAHLERITDVPTEAVDMIRQRMEQRGATVTVLNQPDGLFTVEGTFPDGAAALAALGAPAVAGAIAAAAPADAALLTDLQMRTAKAIVNIFETGEVLGDYGQVTLIPGDSGHLTYGRSQTTLASGLLHDLLQRYMGQAGARFGGRLQPFLPRVAQRDFKLDLDAGFHNLLRAAADDPVMRQVQDAFFDSAFWRPALHDAQALGFVLPLSLAAVYDGRVHGSWQTLRDETIASDGTVQALGERGWVAAYVARRRTWLATNQRADLRPTVYRMDAFQRLIDQDRWDLALPLVVREREISSLALAAMPPHCYDGPIPGARTLAVVAPLLRGLDVRLVQLALSDAGLDVKADGVFGQASSDALRRVQAGRGQAATGVADASAVAELAQRVFAA
jgi:chitosanase